MSYFRVLAAGLVLWAAGCGREPAPLPTAAELGPLVESAATLEEAAAAASLGDADVARELEELTAKLAAEASFSEAERRGMVLARALLLHEKHRDFATASEHFQAGYDLELRNFAAEAHFHYGKAAAMAPEDARCHAGLGRTALQEGRAAEALAHYARALELKPDSAAWTVEYGRCHYELKDDAAALAAFEKARALDEGYAPAYERLAVAHWRMGSYEAAQAELDRFVELGGTPPEGFAERLAQDRAAAAP